jgi:hypothetical protein
MVINSIITDLDMASTYKIDSQSKINVLQNFILILLFHERAHKNKRMTNSADDKAP